MLYTFYNLPTLYNIKYYTELMEIRGRFEGKWEKQAQGWHWKNAELRERVFQIQKKRVKTLLMNGIYILAQG